MIHMESSPQHITVAISSREMKGVTHLQNVCILMNSLSEDGRYSFDEENYSWNLDSSIPRVVLDRALRRLSIFEHTYSDPK